ncbi:MAG: GNAT family N-acetyltransferase [Ornithinibacter sp.]
MAAVSVLFVDPAATGRGVGSALLATAVDHACALERTPVLDVVSESSRAVALYERHGWRVVGRARPPWLPADREPLLLMALRPTTPLSKAPPSPPVDRPVTEGDPPARAWVASRVVTDEQEVGPWHPVSRSQ